MKKLLTNIAASKLIFFITTSVIILGLNLTPLIAHLRHAPEGRTFTLIHNNAQDFFFYQALMNRGASGDWLTTNPYTTEPHQASFIFSYFVWLGKMSKLLNLSYAVIYHLARVFLSILFLFTIYYLLFTIDIYPRLAFFFFLFAAPFMHKVNDGGNLKDVPYMNWWTGMDPIRRVAYLPHHMAGGLLLVITVIILLKYLKKRFFELRIIPRLHLDFARVKRSEQANYELRINYLYISIIIIPLLAFIHPPSLFIILITLPPAVIIYLAASLISLPQGKALAHPRRGNQTKQKSLNYLITQLLNYQSIGLLVYWFIGLFFLYLMVSQTGHGFPWSQYLDWEKKLQFPLEKELIGAFGVLFPLSVIGVLRAFSSKRFDYIFIACWFVVPLILIAFAPSLGISNIRLVQGVPYLPLSVLSVLGIKKLQELIEQILGKKDKAAEFSIFPRTIRYGAGNFQFSINPNYKLLITNYFLPVLSVLLFIIFTLPTLSWNLKDQIREYWPIFGNVYFDNRLNQAFAYINQNFPDKTITLSTFYTGNYLPAFTNTTSYIGHFGYTYNIDKKEPIVRKFFENKMTLKEAKNFLLSNKIALIFQGPEERPIYKDYLYPEVLKPVYDREEVTIYIVR